MDRYSPSTALVVVDLQNDFADPAGSLAVAGADVVVPNVNREVERAAAADAPVVYTQDWHPPSTPHFATEGGTWPVHCVAGSWGAQLHPALRVIGDLLVRKGSNGEDGYSGFTMRDPLSGEEASTGLDELLRERGVVRIVVCGLATDYCVAATAEDAVRRGYATSVVTDAVAAVDLEPGDGAAALERLAAEGVAFEAG